MVPAKSCVQRAESRQGAAQRNESDQREVLPRRFKRPIQPEDHDADDSQPDPLYPADIACHNASRLLSERYGKNGTGCHVREPASSATRLQHSWWTAPAVTDRKHVGTGLLYLRKDAFQNFPATNYQVSLLHILSLQHLLNFALEGRATGNGEVSRHVQWLASGCLFHGNRLQSSPARLCEVAAFSQYADTTSGSIQGGKYLADLSWV
jgi:hypothetical protein